MSKSKENNEFLSKKSAKLLAAIGVSLSINIQTEYLPINPITKLVVFGDRMPKPEGTVTLDESYIESTAFDTVQSVLAMHNHITATVAFKVVYTNTKSEYHLTSDPLLIPFDGIQIAAIAFADVTDLFSTYAKKDLQGCADYWRMSLETDLRQIAAVKNRELLELRFIHNETVLDEFHFVHKDVDFIDEMVERLCRHYTKKGIEARVPEFMSDHRK